MAQNLQNVLKVVANVKKEAIAKAEELVATIKALEPLGLSQAIVNDSEFRRLVLSLTGSRTRTTRSAVNPGNGTKKKRKMSAEAKAAISLKAKARWRKAKRAGKNHL